MLGRVFAPVLRWRPANVRMSSGAPYVITKRASMNNFPIPAGSWQADYNKKQGKNNMILAAGVVSLIGACLYIWIADPLHLEKVFGPYKFMKNPPMFESPVLEPNVLLQHVDNVSVASAKK